MAASDGGAAALPPYFRLDVPEPDLGRAELTAPVAYGAPTERLPAGPIAPSWVNHDGVPLGFGTGSYALGDAGEQGMRQLDPAVGLPGIRTGAVPFTNRLTDQGDQSLMNGVVDRGGSYFDIECEPYSKP